jgi:S-DNA-T family DNA segregation ATPase FtsK/SpoIIIE
VRLVLLYAALDPYVKILIADGKKSADYDKFRLVAHRMVIGDAPNPRDSDPVTHLLELLDEVLAHIAKVNDILSSLPAEMCPEGKLTEELARDPRYPELRVWVVAVEEFQVYFETEDQDVNKQVAGKLQRIMAQGPSAGVSLLSSSQKPSGVGAGTEMSRLFNRYRDNHQARFALKCGNRDVSVAILGGDAYQEGFDASALPIGDEYRGVGILYGVSDQTPTVRTFLAEAPDAEKILMAARQHRERVGTLSGLAAGEDVAREVRDVMADARSVFYAGEMRISWPELAARMSQSMPEHYADLTPDAISAQLRSLGVTAKSVKDRKHFESGTGQGFDLTALEAAINRRQVESR